MGWINLKLDLSNAKVIPEEFYDCDTFVNGLEVTPIIDRDGYGANVWDAGVSIEGENVIISGGFGESGYGSITVRLPRKHVHKHYTFTCSVRDSEELRVASSVLQDAGIEYVHVK